jgi:hypothetical protein
MLQHIVLSALLCSRSPVRLLLLRGLRIINDPGSRQGTVDICKLRLSSGSGEFLDACGCSTGEGKGMCDLYHDEPFPWFFLSFTMNNKISIFFMY